MPYPTRRSLTGPQLALIIGVSGLVFVFVVMLVARLTTADARETAADSGGAAVVVTPPPATVAPPAPATTAPQPEPESTTPPAEPEPRYFTSPTGNIACAIGVEAAECLTRSFDFEPEAPACDSPGGYLRVTQHGAELPCEATTVDLTAEALAYGGELTEHGFTCTSQRSGVTCRHDASGHGFTVARAGYQMF